MGRYANPAIRFRKAGLVLLRGLRRTTATFRPETRDFMERSGLFV